MMSRVAIPVLEGMLSHDFGRCTHFEVFDIDEGTVVRHFVGRPNSNSLSAFLIWVNNMAITDFVADRIDMYVLSALGHQKVNLFVGIDAEPVNELVEKYINGMLRSNIDAIMVSLNHKG